MGEDNSTQPKSALRTIGELGPAWITSITGLIVALTGAGFLVGHATATTNTAAQPTVTIIKTVQAGAAANPASSDSAASDASSSNSATDGSGAANGTQLGSYSIDMADYYSAPLSAAKPTQSQFTSDSGDLFYDGVSFTTRGSDQLVSLPNGTTPTYKACSTGTTFADSAGDTAGSSFCLVEATGKLAGVYVSSEQSDYDVLQVTVWQYVS